MRHQPDCDGFGRILVMGLFALSSAGGKQLSRKIPTRFYGAYVLDGNLLLLNNMCVVASAVSPAVVDREHNESIKGILYSKKFLYYL